MSCCSEERVLPNLATYLRSKHGLNQEQARLFCCSILTQTRCGLPALEQVRVGKIQDAPVMMMVYDFSRGTVQYSTEEEWQGSSVYRSVQSASNDSISA